MSTSRREDRTRRLRIAGSLTLGLAMLVPAAAPAVALAADAPPPNDQFQNATATWIDTFPRTFADVNIADATWEPGERWPCGTTANTVWYKFTYGASNTGAVQVDATGAKVTAFYLPSGTTLADLSSGYCKGTSSLLIPWFAGRTDYVQIAGDGSSDTITVTFTFVPRPPNDDLSQAESVVLGSTTTVDTRTATIERVPGAPTKPQPYDVPGSSCTPSWPGGAYSWSRSVWYRLTATFSGAVTVDPSESSFPDVTLSVYSGNPIAFPASASRVACVRSRSPLTFAVQLGTEYFVQATDAAPLGQPLSGGGTLKLKWIDSTPPVLTLPSDITAEATGPTGASVSYEAMAIDAVDGPVLPICTPPSGSTFAIGTTWVFCRAADHAGNLAGAWFTITVHDTLAPSVAYSSHPESYTVADVIQIGCTASDLVGVVTSTCANVDGFGWEFGLGVHQYAATAIDAAGNVGSGSTQFSVTATYGSMSELTRLWVSKAGVMKDLLAILDSAAAAEARGQFQAEAGKLADYRALVLAQAGKSITSARAQMLVAFSSGL